MCLTYINSALAQASDNSWAFQSFFHKQFSEALLNIHAPADLLKSECWYLSMQKDWVLFVQVLTWQMTNL